MLRSPLLLMLLLAWNLGGPAPAYAHGTERHFGTPINGRGAAPATGGSPAFTLLALSANLTGLERDLQEGRIPEIPERAGRLPAMARELVARVRYLELPVLEQVERSAQFIAERAEHIRRAAARLETERVLREVTLVRDRIAILEDLLRNAEE